MKKISVVLISFILAALFFSACDTEKLMFEENTRYIYFDMPFKIDNYGRVTTEREDSLLYSFAFDDESVTEHTFGLAVSVAGMAVPEDYSYRIEVIPEATNLKDSDWDKSILEQAVIHKSRIFDTLYIKVKRPTSADGLKVLSLRLLPNENFQLSDSILLTAKLCYTSAFIAPDWWSTWEYYMGEFCPEVYVKWREIYFEGADPNGYYWDNMPDYASASWYPVTYMYLTQLKLYFEENEVFPYGDTTKPRIRINL